MTEAQTRASAPRFVVSTLIFIALVVAVVGSLGAPLITSVAATYDVPLSSAQWTLTITLLTGAIATPVLGRLGSGPRRRATVICTLAIVAAGSLLTVLPLSFAWLLIGRAAQGVGLGLTALTMSAARDHLDSRRATSTISLISVASTVGIGIGYPVAGLLTDLAGVHSAYGLGLLMALVALWVAWAKVPQSPQERGAKVDLVGAALLGAGLLALLLPISQTSLWQTHGVIAGVILGAAVLLLAGWAVYERHLEHPLVDLALLRHPTVVGANLTMLLGGIGMYLLLTLITRYVQTPTSAGYGFGASTFVSGLILVPFSAMGFVAGKLTPLLQRRLSAISALAISSAVVLFAFLLFALARSHLAEPVLAMAILGFGVGSFSALMPRVILAVVPADESSSAMGMNQVFRSVGFAIGSAICGLILSANTHHAQPFPIESGYTVAAYIGAATMVVTILVALALRARPGRKTGAQTPRVRGA